VNARLTKPHCLARSAASQPPARRLHRTQEGEAIPIHRLALYWSARDKITQRLASGDASTQARRRGDGAP
jgi:hypothetical protein